MELLEELLALKEKACSLLFKETIYQVYQVFLIVFIRIADCNGGDNELKPY